MKHRDLTGRSTCLRIALHLSFCSVSTLLHTACAQESPKGEQASVEEFASRVLHLYKSRAVSEFLSLLSEAPPESVVETIVPGSPPYEEMFGDDSRKWQAADRWGGEFEETIRKKFAYVLIRKKPSAFGPENPDVLQCARLQHDGENWFFDRFYVAQQNQVKGPEFLLMARDSDGYRKLKERASEILRTYEQQNSGKMQELSIDKRPWAVRGADGATGDEQFFDPSEIEGLSEWMEKRERIFIQETADVKFEESEKASYWVQLVKVEGEWRLKNVKIDWK